MTRGGGVLVHPFVKETLSGVYLSGSEVFICLRKLAKNKTNRSVFIGWFKICKQIYFIFLCDTDFNGDLADLKPLQMPKSLISSVQIN